MDRSGNPKNGTVVDRGVTEPRNWDFYLQAHTAIEGTARPAHYYVVHDEIFANNRQLAQPPFLNVADVLEDLTHNMCYLHGRATKAVSLAPPAYYVDLLCERGRRYLAKFFESSDEDASDVASRSAVSQGPSQDDVNINPDLSNTMFYI